MEMYVFNSKLDTMKMVLTNNNIIEAHEITQINTAGQLIFTVSINSDIDDKIEPTDIVFIKVKDDRYHPYKILSTNMPTPNTIQYTCLEYAYYLFEKDGLVHDKKTRDWSVKQTITEVIKGTQWQVGYVDESLGTISTNFYWQTRTSCFSTIAEMSGAEFEFYMTMANNKITSRTIEVYKQRGTDTHQRFTYGMNALEVVAEEDATNTVTKVYPRGSGEMYNKEGDGQRKLTISDVVWSKENGDPADKPKGQDYLVYGSSVYDLDNGNQPSAIVNFEDETDANKLINRAYEWLKQNNRPKTQFKASVNEVGDLKLGDRVVIDREDLKIKYVTRVFKLDRNLLNEKLNVIELGDVVAHTISDAISNINSQIGSTNDRVDNIKNEIIVNSEGNTITYGPDEPTSKKKGDMWYKPSDIIDGIQQYDMYIWDGEKWVLTMGNQIINELEQKVDQAMEDIENSAQIANEAKDKADKIQQDFNTEVDRINQEMNEFNTDIGSIGNEISSVKENISDINTGINKVNESIFDIENEMLTMGENIFPIPTFEGEVQLSKFSHTSDNDSKVFITNNDYKEGVKEPFIELNTPYKIKNDSDRILRIYGNTSGNRDLSQRKEFEFPIYSGQKFNISFDFRKTFTNGYATVGLMIYDAYSGGTLKKWVSKVFSDVDENWKRVYTTIEIPEGNYKFGKFFVSYQSAKSDKVYVDFDNIYITRADVSQTLIEVSDGKIKTLITEQGKTNQRLETAEGSIQQIENLEGNNTLVNTVNGMKQQIQDNKGNITKIEANVNGIQTQVQDNKQNISTLTQTAEGLRTDVSDNKQNISSLQQTTQSLQTKVQDNEGNISTLTQTVNGFSTRIENAEGNASQAIQTANGLQSQVVAITSNGVNMFPNSVFTDSVLTNYFYGVPSNNNFLVVPKGESDGKTTYGQKKCLKMLGVASRDSTLRTNKFVPCKVGDTFSITFDYFNKSGKSNIIFFCRFQKDDGSKDEYLKSTVSPETSTIWKKAKFEVIAPKNAMAVQFMIGNDKSAQDGSLTYIDNVLVTSTEVSKSEFTQTVEGIKVRVSNNEGNISTLTQTANGLQSQVSTNSNNISTLTQTANGLQTTVTEMQDGLGVHYPNGTFSNTTFNKWYTGNGEITNEHTLKVFTTGTSKGSAFLTDYIEVDGTKPMYVSLEGEFSSEIVREKCKMYVYEYDVNKTETRNTNDLLFKNNEPEQTWSQINKTWEFGTTPKYIRIEWVVFATDTNAYGEMQLKNINIYNGNGGIYGSISQVSQTANGLFVNVSNLNNIVGTTTINRVVTEKFDDAYKFDVLNNSLLGNVYPTFNSDGMTITHKSTVKTNVEVELKEGYYYEMPKGATSVKVKAEVTVTDELAKTEDNTFKMFFPQSNGVFTSDGVSYNLYDLNKGITITVPSSTILTGYVMIKFQSLNTLTPGSTTPVGYSVNVKNMTIEFIGGTTSTGLIGEVEKAQSSISVVEDNINMRVEKGTVFTEINMSPNEFRISGNKIILDGQTEVRDIIIKNANIESVSASKLTAGTIDANKIKVINLDANNITANRAKFIQAAFEDANNSTTINSKGIVTKRLDKMTTALNAGRLEFRDQGSNLTGAIETKDWLLENDYDDTLLFKILGRRQLSVGFAKDEAENDISTFFNIKERHTTVDDNVPIIEFIRDPLLVNSSGYGLKFGQSAEKESPYIGRLDTFEQEGALTTAVQFGKGSLYFTDKIDGVSRTVSLNDIMNGKLKNITFPDGRQLKITDTIVNGANAGAIIGVNGVGIAWTGGDLYFRNMNSVWIKFGDILEKLSKISG